MKKSLFMVALATLTLASCSNDEVVNVQQDAISFNVVADKASRGTVINTTGIQSEGFMVSAFDQDAEVFMNYVTVNYKDGKWKYDNLKFWPVEGDLDFYAYSPLTLDKSNVNFNKDSRTIKYTVPTACSDQLDLLYAVNTGLTKADAEVDLNFRHALSQIVFQAKNVHAGLKVEITGVRVVNVLNDGTLTLPNDVTMGTDGAWGVWALNTTKKSYPAAVQAEAVVLDGATEATLISNDKNPLLLMPQTITPAAVKDGNMVYDGNTFFAIKCKITSEETDENGNVIGSTVLWPKNDGYAEVVIPATAPDGAWKQGVKYVYTFIFGEGGGYVGPNGPDAEDPSNPEDPTAPVDPKDPSSPEVPGEPSKPADPNEPGEPVLVPVTFVVTVDDFQIADINTDMK